MMISIRVEGLDRIASELRAMPNRLSREAQREALRKSGELIRQRSSALAPREPGAPDLADNIGMSNIRPDDGSVGIAIGPTKNFFYGVFQEEGTSRHGAQPFMRPAFDSEAPRALKAISGEFWAAIIRRGGGSARGFGGGGGLL